MKIIRCFASLIPLLQIFYSATAYPADWVVFEGGNGPGKGKHIVFLSGDEEYRAEEGLPMLAKILADRHAFKCTDLFSINSGDGRIDPAIRIHRPGMDVLDHVD